MKPHRLFVAIVLCIAAPVLHAANVNIGDTPKIQFAATDGTRVDLAQLKGKLVIVDFWATWCGPCMGEAPHMVKINQTYGDKGLQMVGISLDEDRAQMIAVAKEKGLIWPQYFDGQARQNKFAVQFAVQSIPFTMLIGPDGSVLWTGHPALIDDPLAQAFKNHPPQLVDPAVMQSARDILSQIKERLAAHDAKGAIALLAKIPPAAKTDASFATDQQEAEAKVQTAAKRMLADVQPMIDAKEYAEAVRKLRELSSALAGTPSGDKARQMLQNLVKDPHAQQAIADEQKQANAAAALETAQKLQADKKDALAYTQYKQIVASFPGTDAATTAAQAVSTYEQNTALMAKITDETKGRKAKALLSMAKTYVDSGQTDLAVKKYQEVVEQFSGTDYATTAQQALSDLGASVK
jgi:thiol-disulfide isomerase/thioredoxin